MPPTRIGGRLVKDGGLTDADIAPDNKDGAAAVPSMRTLGTGSSQAAAGDDSRFKTFVEEVPSGVINGRNRVFTVTSAPSPLSSLSLYLRGKRMTQGTSSDYTVSGTTITFSSRQIPRPGDSLYAEYRY